jgi:23S rRNA pseudouridine955/2504/2580 synthase
MTTVTVADDEGALRLDRWFKRHYPAFDHGRLEKLLRTGRIRVDGKRARASDRVAPGQEIRIPTLNHYRGIVPCGIAGHGVTSLAALGVSARMAEVDDVLGAAFPAIFAAAGDLELPCRSLPSG